MPIMWTINGEIFPLSANVIEGAGLTGEEVKHRGVTQDDEANAFVLRFIKTEPATKGREKENQAATDGRD